MLHYLPMIEAEAPQEARLIGALAMLALLGVLDRQPEMEN